MIKPKITKPWSKEMYEYNDYVARLHEDGNRNLKSTMPNKMMIGIPSTNL